MVYSWSCLGMSGENGAEPFHHIRLFGGQVSGFERISRVVVEFDFRAFRRCTRFLPFDEAMLLSADGAAERFPWKRMIGMVAHPSLRVLEHGHQADPVDGLRTCGRRQLSEFRERGKDVHAFGKLAPAWVMPGAMMSSGM